MPLLTPGQLAQRAGVTVRTLHHYEALGLLAPQRSEAGHRRYREADVAGLRRIVWLRRLGFALDRIGLLLAADADADAALVAMRAQRDTLEGELVAAAAQLQALDRVLLTLQQRRPKMSLHDLAPPLSDPGAAPFADEARARWGSSPQWHHAEARRRARSSGDTAAMQAEEVALLGDWATLLRNGAPADGDAARALVERHRQHLHRWHYPCSREMHAQLAALYTGDARFAAHFDRHAPGLAAFVAAGIVAAQ
jgi:MerR family transcriptional regulator, thiopeptide resistance regulator